MFFIYRLVGVFRGFFGSIRLWGGWNSWIRRNFLLLVFVCVSVARVYRGFGVFRIVRFGVCAFYFIFGVVG